MHAYAYGGILDHQRIDSLDRARTKPFVGKNFAFYVSWQRQGKKVAL